MGGGTDQIQNMIYISGDRRNHCFHTSGISFHEFASNIPSPLHHLLLLKHKFEWTDLNYHTMLEYVEEEAISRLLATNVEQFGEFCWLDFQDVQDIDQLEPAEVAELLYVAHKKEPLHKAFFPLLRNKYVYLSREDGLYTKVYCRKIHDFYAMLSKVIPYKLSAFDKKKLMFFQKSKIYPALAREVMEQIIPYLDGGLVIDLLHKTDTRKALEIPIYVTGSFTSTADVIGNITELIEEASKQGLLIFDRKEQQWSVSLI